MFHQNEVEQSTYNFEHSDADFLFTAFNAHEKQAKYLMEQQLALPAYEQVLKAAHTFNLLDARGAIGVTERAAYIGRIRNLARAVAQSYLREPRTPGLPDGPARVGGADAQEGCLNGRKEPSMTTQNLLVELFVEELPPRLSRSWAMPSPPCWATSSRPRAWPAPTSVVTPFASPRRLAAHVTAVADQGRRQGRAAKADARDRGPGRARAMPRPRC